MSVAVERPQAESGRVVLHEVPWSKYEALLGLFGDRRLRITYDRGTLEIMSPSPLHERFKSLFTRMIETLADEMDVDYFSLGSTTFVSRALELGLEPDACFLIASAGRVPDWRLYDPANDPPPDLALEIDVASDSRPRLGVYAALKIPEVWRFDGSTLTILALRDGRYAPTSQSPSFPTAPVDKLAAFVRDYRSGNDRLWIRDFRSWVRDAVAPRDAE